MFLTLQRRKTFSTIYRLIKIQVSSICSVCLQISHSTSPAAEQFMQDDRFRSDLGLQNDEPINSNMFSRHVTEIDSGFLSFTSTLPPELVKEYKDAGLEGPSPDQISFGPLFLISGMAFTALHATSDAFVCGDVSTRYQWGYAYLIFLLFGLFHRQCFSSFFSSSHLCLSNLC